MSALSAKVPEPSEYLERLLLGLHQGRGVGADAAQRVGPFRAGWALRVQSKGGRVEEYALALDLLDDGSLGQHVLEGLPGGQPAGVEQQPPELGQRVILISQRSPDAVLGA